MEIQINELAIKIEKNIENLSIVTKQSFKNEQQRNVMDKDIKDLKTDFNGQNNRF